MDLFGIGSAAAGVATAGASIYGADVAAKSQRETNVWNAAEAEKNRGFQERMSSSAHQREVEDLKMAGLNPILSATGGGSSSPSGSIIAAENPEKGRAAAMADAVRGAVSAVQIKKLNAETATARASAGIMQAKEWSAKNVQRWEKKNPDFYGQAGAMRDSFGPKLSGLAGVIQEGREFLRGKTGRKHVGEPAKKVWEAGKMKLEKWKK